MRVGLALVLASAWAVAQPTEAPKDASGVTVPLHVTGGLELTVSLGRSPNGSRISGTLSDELGRPVSGRVKVVDETGSPPDLTSCRQSPSEIPWNPQGDGESWPTQADGSFCVLSDTAPELASRWLIQVEAEHYGALQKRVGAVDRTRPPRITKAPRAVNLSTSAATVVEVLAPASTNRERTRLGLDLECAGEIHRLGNRQVGASERAMFEIAPSEFPTPGRCRLWVTDETNGQHSEVRELVLQSEVTLSATPREFRNRVELDLAVGRDGARVPDGLLEFREAGAFVASAPVNEGRANIEFERGTERRELTVSYVPSNNIWLPGSSLRVSIPARAPSAWRWLGHALVLGALFGWLALIWLGRRSSARASRAIAPPLGVAGVRGLGRARGAIGGRIRDAHTGAAVAGARVRLLSCTATRRDTVEELTTDAQGNFQGTTRVEEHPLLRLEVESDATVPLTEVVSTTEAEVLVIHRRRALLRALLHWSQRALPLKRPTPGQLAHHARQRGNETWAAWANEVAEAAYGPEPPSLQQVQDLSSPEQSS